MLYFLLLILFIINAVIPQVQVEAIRWQSIIKTCHANIRLIMGGVEMYNMDHPIIMKEVDLNVLINNGYLKHKPLCPKGGNYFNDSDLDGQGIVFCSYHGFIQQPDAETYKRALKKGLLPGLKKRLELESLRERSPFKRRYSSSTSLFFHELALTTELDILLYVYKYTKNPLVDLLWFIFVPLLIYLFSGKKT
ncbi:hypothetical protein ACFL35_08340 [Candidatus Riflebacteria bacterium]